MLVEVKNEKVAILIERFRNPFNNAFLIYFCGPVLRRSGANFHSYWR